MEENREKQSDYPSSLVERLGCVSIAFLGIALVGIVYVSCTVVIELWPGTGRPVRPEFVFSVLIGGIGTAVALLLAWCFRL
jgi:hypothetical protein